VIERLRPTYTPEELAEIYAMPPVYEWPGHRVRREATIAFGEIMWEGLLAQNPVLADLACGDGSIARRITRTRSARVILGDVCERPDIGMPVDRWFEVGEDYREMWVRGPIEATLPPIAAGSIDMLLLSETLEHLDDPASVLATARAKARYMLLTTPCAETVENVEHYWRWDIDGVRALLGDAGWQGQPDTLSFDGYVFQIWRCW
jgi:2-polyprenyl-3-methyl-5-hydroxy-6-metoxy-1,4-benzoquinol methylase